jgi:hypothetical protein
VGEWEIGQYAIIRVERSATHCAFDRVDVLHCADRRSQNCTVLDQDSLLNQTRCLSPGSDTRVDAQAGAGGAPLTRDCSADRDRDGRLMSPPEVIQQPASIDAGYVPDAWTRSGCIV